MLKHARILIMLTCIFLLYGSMSLRAEDDAGQSGVMFNFDNVDIQTVIMSVAKITGKNFIVDPSIKGKVTIVSSSPMSSRDIYKTFLQILDVHNYSAVDSGEFISIVPNNRAVEYAEPAPAKEGRSPADSNFITRIYQLQYADAEKIVPVIKPLMSQKSYIAANSEGNSVIISDNRDSIVRLVDIIASIDRNNATTFEVIPLNHAEAREIVSMIEGVAPGTKKGGDLGNQTRIIADERTNSILLSGDAARVAWAKNLIERLDSPVEEAATTQVVFLRHAVAKDLVPILKGVDPGEAAQGGHQRDGGIRSNASVQADEATNSLIISASSTAMKSILSIIEQLDIRRGQVMIEAVVAEVSLGKSADLGIQFRSTTSGNTSGVIGGTDFSSGQRPTGGINNVSINPLAGLASGLNIGYFDGTTTILGTEILNLGVLVSALQSNADTNILSTPTIMTLDNQEAEISVGENVPFATGSYTSANNNNPENPFTTYERKDVGVKLKIKPKINEGNTIRLEISQEVSKIIQDSSGATPGLQRTDSRMISTTVNVEDGKIIVLGGLISDNVEKNVLKIPIIGNLPLIGTLFSYTYSKHEKKNLMVFIHPIIIREEEKSQAVTMEKYEYMRNAQEEFNQGGISLMPDEIPPILPELNREETSLQGGAPQPGASDDAR